MDLMFQKLGCMIVVAVFVSVAVYIALFTFLSMGAYVQTVLP